MPKVDSLETHQNDFRPQVRKPVGRTPLDQTKRQPVSLAGNGKLGGVYPKTRGGTMNGGGKSRPGHNARRGID